MSGANQRRKAVRILVFCTILWGLSFPVMKALTQTQQNILPHSGSWFFTSLGVMYRFGFAGLILGVIYLRQLRTTTRRELEQGIVLAVFGGGGILFQMDGLAYTDASVSAFLTQGYCLFIPLWVAVVNRRWPSLKIVLSTVLVVIGVAVLAQLNLHSLKLGRGELETLIASLLFTGQILVPRTAALRREPSGQFFHRDVFADGIAMRATGLRDRSRAQRHVCAPMHRCPRAAFWRSSSSFARSSPTP